MAGNMNNLMAILIETGVDANYDYVTTRGFEVVEIIGTTNATDGGTTNTPQRGVGGVFNALGAALATDTVDDIEYGGTIINAQATFAAGDTLRMVTNGSATADQADMYVWVIPTSWVSG